MKSSGHRAKIAGYEAEKRVTEELDAVGWPTAASAELDYANKTDVLTVCPAGTEWALQVSTSPKSARQRNTLEQRGVSPVAISELDRQGLGAADFICAQLCKIEECPIRPVTTEAPVSLTQL